MALLFGYESIPNIKKVHDAYMRVRIQRILPSLSLKYHPLMGINNIESLISIEDWLYLNRINDLLDFSEKNLTIQNRVYKQTSSLTPLYGKNPRYSIEPKYSFLYPEAKLEFESALELIRIGSPWQYRLFKNIINQICPITYKNMTRFNGGASDYNLIGIIFSGLKPGPCSLLTLGISLCHELGHNVLMLYQAGQYPISKQDFNALVYSGVRKVARPSLASLHACVALGYMLHFCLNTLKNLNLPPKEVDYLKAEILKYRIGLDDGLRALSTLKMNNLGLSVYNELKEFLQW